jgi:GAF domain-containing protein
VPLFYDDQIIGVLELLDKEGAPSFSATDTAALGLFANQAAVAISQSRTHSNLAALIREVLGSLAGLDDATRARLQPGALAFTETLADEDLMYRRALELAGLVQQIAWEGDRELALCRTILRGFAEYLGERPDRMSGWGTL